MNKENLSFLKLVGVTIAIFILTSLSIKSTSSGIHIHDTYFVMSTITKVLVFFVFSSFVGSLIASILSKFKNRLYIKTLIISVLLLISASIYIFSLFVKVN